MYAAKIFLSKVQLFELCLLYTDYKVLKLKKFSCAYFFSGLSSDKNKDKLLKKFFVKPEIVSDSCRYEKSEAEVDFSPEKHLMSVHGFLAEAPGSLKRGLEVELCRFVEKYLIDEG